MQSDPTPPIVDGKIFVSINTLNTQYANNKLELWDKDQNRYRIDIEEILPFIQDQKWHLVKKTKYQHLIRAI